MRGTDIPSVVIRIVKGITEAFIGDLETLRRLLDYLLKEHLQAIKIFIHHMAYHTHDYATSQCVAFTLAENTEQRGSQALFKAEKSQCSNYRSAITTT